MTRIRIFFGSFFAVIGIPMMVRVIADPSLPAVSYLFAGSVCAGAVALLWPEKWVD